MDPLATSEGDVDETRRADAERDGRLIVGRGDTLEEADQALWDAFERAGKAMRSVDALNLVLAHPTEELDESCRVNVNEHRRREAEGSV